VSSIVFPHTFRSNNWETVETAWNIPGRRICVAPTLPLRVKTAFFTTGQSSSGCIDYGGIGSVAVQRVQTRGTNGQTIQVTQTLPISP
jgi:hypothetical protein